MPNVRTYKDIIREDKNPIMIVTIAPIKDSENPLNRMSYLVMHTLNQWKTNKINLDKRDLYAYISSAYTLTRQEDSALLEVLKTMGL